MIYNCDMALRSQGDDTIPVADIARYIVQNDGVLYRYLPQLCQELGIPPAERHAVHNFQGSAYDKIYTLLSIWLKESEKLKRGRSLSDLKNALDNIGFHGSADALVDHFCGQTNRKIVLDSSNTKFSNNSTMKLLKSPSTSTTNPKISVPGINAESINCSEANLNPIPEFLHQAAKLNIPSLPKQPLKVLGEGSFGRVYKVPNVTFPHIPPFFALKEIYVESLIAKRCKLNLKKQGKEIQSQSLTFPQAAAALSFMFNEVKTLCLLQSQYVLKYYGCRLEGPQKDELEKMFKGLDHAYELEQCEDSLYLHKLMGDNRFFIQTEFCESDLRKWLKARPLQEQRVPQECFELSRQLLPGIEYIHSKGVVHRDLRPENIFLAAGNTVKIGDFGLARDFCGESTSSLTFQFGASLYQSPELWKGEEYNHLTDIYSFGVIMFELHFALTWSQFASLDKLKSPSFSFLDLQSLKEMAPLKEVLIRFQDKAEFALWLATHDTSRRPTASIVINKIEEIYNSPREGT